MYFIIFFLKLFKDHTFVNSISILLYSLFNTFLKRCKQFLLQEEKLYVFRIYFFFFLNYLIIIRPQFVDMTRNKMLLYLYNNLILSKQKILPNIWNYIKQHNYKQIDPIIKKITENVNELQEILILQYRQETIKPIIANIGLKQFKFQFMF